VSTRLVLASASPRRRELLARLGLEPEVRPAGVDETPRAGEAAVPYVLRLAGEKAAAVPGDLVLAADTAVVLDGEILGKPDGPAGAARMLEALSGRTHLVHTGVAVRSGATTSSAVSTSSVTFAPLTAADIAWYVATGEPFDKAGAYAVQGAGGLFVVAIEGSFSNVVGLPLHLLPRLFAAAGHRFPPPGAARR
jgi:septum formation protein